MDIDAAIDIQTIVNKDNKALYVHLHPAFFAFVIEDISTNEIIVCQSQLVNNNAEQISPTALSLWLKEHQAIFNIHYNNTKVAINTLGFQLLNHPDLATQKSFEILNNFSELTHQLVINNIDEEHIVQFAINKKILKTLKGHFNKDAICFGDLGLLQSVIKSDKKNAFVIAQILNNEITLAAFNNQSLQFFNKFNTQNQEDVLYYILSVYQNCNLNPNEHQLYLTGLIEKQSPLYQLIFDYIRNVDFTAGFTNKKMMDSSFSDSPHYYYNLFNLGK